MSDIYKFYKVEERPQGLPRVANNHEFAEIRTARGVMRKVMEILGKREALKAVVEFCGKDLVYKNVRAGDFVVAYDASRDQLTFYEAEHDFDSHMDLLVLSHSEPPDELEKLLKQMPELGDYNLIDEMHLKDFHRNMQVWSRKFAAYCKG